MKHHDVDVRADRVATRRGNVYIIAGIFIIVAVQLLSSEVRFSLSSKYDSAPCDEDTILAVLASLANITSSSLESQESSSSSSSLESQESSSSLSLSLSPPESSSMLPPSTEPEGKAETKLVAVDAINVTLRTEESKKEDEVSTSPLRLSPRYPPLNSIVRGRKQVIGDPSWLLDFVIAAFPKTGTTALMEHLRFHPDVLMEGRELCHLKSPQEGGHNRLVRLLYNTTTDSYLDAKNRTDFDGLVRGIKCPTSLDDNGILNLKKYFPQAKLVIGIRHPVLWFESYHNFKVEAGILPPPAELLTSCQVENKTVGVCTPRTNFHLVLSKLGKTNMTLNPDEKMHVQEQFRHHLYRNVHRTENKVFLYDMTQLAGNGTTEFRADLQGFLNLSNPINPISQIRPMSTGKSSKGASTVHINSEHKIDICIDKYSELRKDLMIKATGVSRWIRQYFLKSDDVYVSPSKDHFATLMESWEQDPCIMR